MHSAAQALPRSESSKFKQVRHCIMRMQPACASIKHCGIWQLWRCQPTGSILQALVGAGMGALIAAQVAVLPSARK